MSHKSCFVIVLFLSLLLILSGCIPREANEKKEVITVITTIFPLGDIVKQVGGEKVDIIVLLKSGDSPHTFEPTVEQARIISGADLLFFIGKGLDNWVVKLAENEELTMIEITEYLDDWLLKYEPLHLGEEDQCKHDYDYDTDDYYNHKVKKYHYHYQDPHIWMDPILVKEGIAPLVAKKLKEISPKDASYFDCNLENFGKKLDALDNEIKSIIGNFSQRRFISYHSAWSYYANRYGLKEVASVEEYPGQEPSAKWLSELVHLANKYKIDIIFAEPQLRKKCAKVIADEISGKVLILDPLGGEGISERDSYINLIMYNTKVFQDALE